MPKPANEKQLKAINRIVVRSAYGRKFESEAQARTAWAAGWDFEIVATNPEVSTGTYINVYDWKHFTPNAGVRLQEPAIELEQPLEQPKEK